MDQLLANLTLGFSIALSPFNLLMAAAGVTVGQLIGALPGIGPVSGVALLLPLTFGMHPTSGIIMLADPQPGLTYRQEHLEAEAEDFATVLDLDSTAMVPFGSFDGLLRTEDVNPLGDPKQVENKLYAKGVGPVLTISIEPDKGSREELLSYTAG